jgi:hypothetical protein
MQKEKRAESAGFLHKKISVALAKKCMLVLSSCAVVNVKAQLFEKAQSPGEKCGGHRGFRERAEICDKAQSFWKGARSAGILKKMQEA